MSRNQRFVLLGVAAVIAVVAVILIGSGGSDNSTRSSGPTTITVKDAKPVGGIKTVTFKKLDVTSALGLRSTVKVEVKGVKGETKLTNNSQSYPVFFSIG